METKHDIQLKVVRDFDITLADKVLTRLKRLKALAAKEHKAKTTAYSSTLGYRSNVA